MKRISASASVRGFTVTDVLVAVGVLALLLSWAYFALMPRRGHKVSSARVNCTSNLRSVGLAFRMWSNDHQEQFPWQVGRTNDGTLEYVASPEVFRHFQAASNEITSAKPLFCPADAERHRTHSFVTNFSNTNISYFLGLDADETQPHTILLGDRNVATNGVAVKGPVAQLHGDTGIGWTKELHNRAGNIALADGSAMQCTAEQFRRQVGLASNAVVRLAIP